MRQQRQLMNNEQGMLNFEMTDDQYSECSIPQTTY